MTDIFKCKETMPMPDEGVVRVTMTSAEFPGPRLPGERKNPDAAVESAPRPKLGHHY